MPRLAELVVTTQSPQSFVDPEILFSHLADARSWEWPEPEVAALHGFAAALVERMRDEPLDAKEVDAWICAIGQIRDDITPILAPLVVDTSAARHNLFFFYEWNRRSIEKRRALSNAFWAPRSVRGKPPIQNPNVERIVNWLQQPDVAAAVDRAYAEMSAKYFG